MLEVGKKIYVRPHPLYSEWFSAKITWIGIEVETQYIDHEGVSQHFNFYRDGWEMDNQVSLIDLGELTL